MTELVPITLYGWIAVVLALFSALPARRAVIASFLGAWLFLPQGQIMLQGLPDITKITVTSFGVLVGVILFDASRIWAYRPHWVDIPIVVYCLSPFMSSVTNGLGAYDGLSMMLTEIATWGVPFFIGRLYFTEPSALRDLAIGIVIGGLVYIPFCLIEVRMSPQLHRWVYGYHQHSFLQTMRWGGYRPMVFMQHGLMVGMWMISATLAAFWLWKSNAIRALFGFPAPLIFAGLFITSVLCKSAGALMLLFVGFGVWVVSRYVRIPALIVVMVAVPLVYVGLRVENLWHGEQLVAMAEQVNEERAFSLESRFENEVLILDKAMEKPLYGWGGWGRWRVIDPYGNDITTADSLWIITLGQQGMVGLAGILVVVLLPPLLFLRRVSLRAWLHPQMSSGAVISVLLILYMYDGMLNAMLNPIFLLGAGGLSGFYIIAPRLKNEEEQRTNALRGLLIHAAIARAAAEAADGGEVHQRAA